MKRILLLLTTLCVISTKASAETEAQKTLEVRNIEYDYEMVDYGSSWDCIGSLRLDLHFPMNTKYIIIRTSKPHIKPGEPVRIYNQGTNTISEGQTSLLYYREKVRWGTYFVVYAVLESGEYIKSPLFYSNDFMRPEDVERILEYTAIEVPEEMTGVDIRVEGRALHIGTQREVNLSIFTTAGNRIFSGSTSSPLVIPLDNLSPQVIILRYNIDNTVKTQKIILK